MSVINYDHGDDDYGDSVIHSVSKSVSQSAILPSQYYQRWKKIYSF